jgi:hypothetical protein
MFLPTDFRLVAAPVCDGELAEVDVAEAVAESELIKSTGLSKPLLFWRLRVYVPMAI